MSEPLKVADPSQKYKIAIFLAFFVVAGLFGWKLIGTLNKIQTATRDVQVAVENIKQPPLGGITATDLDATTIQHGNVVCGATSSQALAAFSGRAWMRLTNVTGSLIYLRLTTSTAPYGTSTEFASVRQGITLGVASSGYGYWDSQQSNINWQGAVQCVADTTNSLMTYIQAR